MDIVAWREVRNDDKTVVCRIQLKYKDGRKVRTLLRELSEWQECSEGFSPREKKSILILQKKFQDDGKWKSFLRGFPFRIVEKTPTNKERIYNAKKII
jgi:hypothetical protein